MSRRAALGHTAVLVATALASAGLSGCGQLLSTQEVAMAVLLSTPSVTNPSDSTKTIPGATTFSVFLGSADPTQLLSGQAVGTNAITPQDDATVTLTYTDATTHMPVSVSVPSKGAGTGAYLVAGDSMLQYEQVPYTVTIVRGGSTYMLTGTPPSPEKIKEFESNAVLMNQDVSMGFTVTRDPTRSPEPIAFVAMAAVDSSLASNPTALDSGATYTNAPSDALGFLNLLLSPGQWETDSFTIPASAFSSPSMTPYLITLTPVSQGAVAPGSATLSIFSNFLIGQASAGVVVSK